MWERSCCPWAGWMGFGEGDPECLRLTDGPIVFVWISGEVELLRDVMGPVWCSSLSYS